MASIVAAVLFIIALIHMYWAAGGRAGRAAAIPAINDRPTFAPSAALTMVVAGCLLVAAYVIAITGHLVSSPLAPIARWMTFAVAFLFLARAIEDFRFVGFFKRQQASRFARLDTIAYAPLCLVLAIATGYIASGSS